MIASFSFASQAGDYNNSVPKDKALMAQKINQAAILNAHPTDTFGDQYNPNPSETRYYSDDDSAMNEVAQSALASSDIAKTTHIVKNKQPSADALENSSFVKTNKLFFTDAYNVAHGISDDQIDCENGHTCHFVFEPKSCEKTIPATIHCNKSAIPHTKKVPYKTTVSYSGDLIKHSQYSYSYIANESGILQSISVKFANRNHNSFQCNDRIYSGYINGISMGQYKNNGCSWEFYWLPFSKSGLNISVQKGQPVSVSFNCKMLYQIYDRRTRKIIDKWVDCPHGGLDENIDWYIYSTTMQVTRYKKEGYITWGDTVCP